MILNSAHLADGSIVDLAIDNGVISEIGSNLGKGHDCAGLIALPGLVDLHTHLREPGFEASETIDSGSRSAAAGGYVAVFAMANTHPVQDSVEIVEWVAARGEEVGLVHVQPIGAITKSIAGKELSPLTELANSNAQVRVFSDDGNCLMDTALMRQALIEVKGFGGVIAQHAQNHDLTPGSQMNDGALSQELGLKGWSSIAEEEIIRRDVELALETQSRLHVCHLTTAGAVELVRWGKQKGASITAEVTPHHLLLTEELVRSYNPIYKVNPPLRTKEDTLALRSALLDGTIDILATDHAPHSKEKKECDWPSAAFGMVGLEAAASVLYQVLIVEGGRSWSDFARITSSRPAEIGGLKGFGEIAVGKRANLCLFDPSSKRVAKAQTQSLSVNNPWQSRELLGEVERTIYRGKVTYTRSSA